MRDVLDSLSRSLAASRDALRQRLTDRAAAEAVADVRHIYAAVQGRLDSQWQPLLEAFQRGFLEILQGRRSAAAKPAADELRLVDDDVVEWEIALGGYVQRLAAAGGGELSAFEQRLAVLTDGESEERGGEQGLTAGAIGMGLRLAVEALATTLAERRAVLPGLTALLAEALPGTLATANGTLAARGIECNPAARKKPKNERAGQDILAALQKMAGQPAAGAPGTPGGNGGAGGAGGAFAGGGMGFVSLPPAAIESLNRLQDLDRLVLASGDESQAPVGGSALREFRQREGQNLPPMEAATIDVVATIFDLIFEDTQVPDAIKALIGRLQIPMLKVAMNDKTFFSDVKHPARALLDMISRASVAVGRDLTREHPFYELVRGLVNRILGEFEKDPQIFIHLLPEMEAHLASQDSAASALVERSKQVAEQQETSDLAQIRAEEAIEQVLKEGMGDEVPSLVVEFLSRHWPNVLKNALLSGGVSGGQWGVALQTLVDLLWSLQPKAAAEERQRLLSMLPGLLRRIGGCLDLGKVEPGDRTPFLDALVQLHSAAMKGVRKQTLRGAKQATKNAPAEPVPDSSIESRPSTTVVTRVFQEDGIEVESISIDGKLKAAYPVRIADLENIQRGDWVEFTESGGGRMRARLSWISPHRGVMLFTNPDASRAVSITPEALALQFKNGNAVLLSEEPLLERVMTKAVDAMQPA